MPASSTLALPGLSREVLAYAAETGVAEYLAAILEMTNRIFPRMLEKVTVEDDPEIPDNRQIIIYVHTGNMDGEQLFKTSSCWGTKLFNCCPSTHTHIFCLDQVTE